MVNLCIENYIKYKYIFMGGYDYLLIEMWFINMIARFIIVPACY